MRLLNCDVGEDIENPLDSKEIQPVHPKGNQSCIFIARTDVEAETPILWLPDAKNWLIWKDSDAGRDWRWEEKGMTEDEMVGWHHQFNGHEFEQAPGVDDGQGSLACCSTWGFKESDMTKQLNWAELKGIFYVYQLGLSGICIQNSGLLESKRDKHYSFQKVALVRLIYDLIEKYHD